MRYLLLVAPSANRVYAGEAARLTRAELAVFGETVLAGRLHELAHTEVAGVPYLEFTTDRLLSPRELGFLSRVSTAFALFAREGDLLRPVALPPSVRYDDDLVTIPKYVGKTNEQFTQLLLNVTVLASTHAPSMLDHQLVVLDPLCGRGTTLNQALRYGYDATGIEVDRGHVDAYSAFLRTWLRRKRLKHTVDLHPVRHEGKRVARKLTATLAPTKEAFRSGDTQRVTVFHADTVDARRLLRPGCCDVIVTDLPYSVSHRSRTDAARGPMELLAAAVPVWAELLRPGGALGLSFNTHVAPRDKVAAALSGAGLPVTATATYEGFSHWVDQGITRDLLVARKPPR